MISFPEQRPQQQGSLSNQLEQVKAYFRRETPVSEPVDTTVEVWTQIANRLGCYDAADYIRMQDGPIDYCKLGYATRMTSALPMLPIPNIIEFMGMVQKSAEITEEWKIAATSILGMISKSKLTPEELIAALVETAAETPNQHLRSLICKTLFIRFEE
jgi:hypothetical protein